MVLTLGPLSGSFITEPAAMTVTALLLVSMFHSPPARLAYFLMAVLFVECLCRGGLDPLRGATDPDGGRALGLGLSFVFEHFGLKSITIVIINALILCFCTSEKTFSSFVIALVKRIKTRSKRPAIPVGVTLVHLLFLVMIVLTAHYMSSFYGIFLFFS